MKNLLVLTAVSAILVASGSAMAGGSSTPSIPPIIEAISPAGAVAFVGGHTGGGAAIAANRGTSAAGLAATGQTANVSASGMSGVSTYNLNQVIKGGEGMSAGGPNLSRSETTLSSQTNGTQVAISLENVMDKNNVDGFTSQTQGLTNDGSVMVGVVASAIPSADVLPQVDTVAPTTGGNNHNDND